MRTLEKKLYRSKDNKVILGVMGGLGEYFDIDPVLLRVFYVVISIFTAVFPGIIAYILMAAVMPYKPENKNSQADSSETK